MDKDKKTTQDQEPKLAERELDEKELESVAGGVRRTGPGTQTEDDIYVGVK
jgi:hypothetical protein